MRRQPKRQSTPFVMSMNFDPYAVLERKPDYIVCHIVMDKPQDGYLLYFVTPSKTGVVHDAVCLPFCRDGRVDYRHAYGTTEFHASDELGGDGKSVWKSVVPQFPSHVQRQLEPFLIDTARSAHYKPLMDVEVRHPSLVLPLYLQRKMPCAALDDLCHTPSHSFRTKKLE
jgi:hypothetical protein